MFTLAEPRARNNTRLRRGASIVLALFLPIALLVRCDNPTEPVPSLPPVEPSTVLFVDEVDDENQGKGVNNYTDLTNWEVIAGCIDLHGNGFYDVQPGKGLYIDLDGSCRQAGTIETKAPLTLQPGSYTLEFWLAGNQRRDTNDTVLITLGELFREELTLARREPFKLYARTVVVSEPASAKLRFAHSGGDDEGILFDLVRVRRNP